VIGRINIGFSYTDDGKLIEGEVNMDLWRVLLEIILICIGKGSWLLYYLIPYFVWILLHHIWGFLRVRL
jgi:hypothetical protein